MTFESVLRMLGGIGMFLYGMKLMGNSLESAAGAKMEKILEKLTSNKAKGVALGAGVTAVIQSSAATIIMVVGFLNAGILKLAQGVPVIMGANIGTTITAQILRMGDISGDNIFLMLLKPSTFAPILIVVSAFILLMSKRQSLKDKTGIFMGLGILFMGMTLMQNSFAPMAESEEFSKLFTLFENPFLGVAVGMAVTVLLQSSSAAVGVLQATASTGVVTFAMAAPIAIGCNLGKCVTVLLASIGVNRDAKRAVSIDVTMCVLGSIIFLVVIYLYQGIIGFDFVFGKLEGVEPLNTQRLMHSGREFFAVATCLETASPEAFANDGDIGLVYKAVQASASMPFVSKPVEIKGKHYLDGGCSCKIPYRFALERDFEKIVVVRTRPRNYRKKLKMKRSLPSERIVYRDYPEFAEKLKRSSIDYNLQCDELEELEAKGRIFVIAPSEPITVGRLEGDMEKLGGLYRLGYEDTKAAIPALKEYLNR